MTHISVWGLALAALSVAVVMHTDPSPVSAQTSPPDTTFDADVDFRAPQGNEIVELQATLVVPPRLSNVGSVFLWPGLQPDSDSRNFLPIDNGVLQSVLTWGDSCAPRNQPPPHSSWWISAQYVNSEGHEPGFTDCHSGKIMLVEPGDRLRIRFQLSHTEWFQSIRNVGSGKEVTFKFDLKDQAQRLAIFAIETAENAIAPNVVVFEDVVLRFRNPNPDQTGCGVSLSPMKSSKVYWDQKVIGLVPPAGGRECTVQRIRLSKDKRQ